MKQYLKFQMIFNISLTYIYKLYWSSLSGVFSYNIQAVNGNYKLKNYKNTNWTTIIAINTLRNAIKIQKYNNKLRGERDISKSVTQPNCSNYAALCNFLVTTEHQHYININTKHITFSASLIISHWKIVLLARLLM